MAIKEVYTSQEVAQILSLTRQGVEWKANAERWQSRRRTGRGGGKEWLVSSMPEETRMALRIAEEKQALAVCSAPPAQFSALSPMTTTAIMDDKRRYKALAKADLVRQYLTWQRKYGATRIQKREFVMAYERYTDTLGPLPDGAVTERLEKPAPTLDETRADALRKVDKAVSTAILAGFDYETAPGTGTAELLHFSYDSFDQQNFADSANVATLAMSGTGGLPTSVTWNAYRNYTVDTGGELVRLVFEPSGFLRLYTTGALVHKATQMEIGGQRKEAVGAAASVEEIRALLAGWGL